MSSLAQIRNVDWIMLFMTCKKKILILLQNLLTNKWAMNKGILMHSIWFLN